MVNVYGFAASQQHWYSVVTLVSRSPKNFCRRSRDPDISRDFRLYLYDFRK